MKKSVAFTLPFVLASALTTASAFTLNGTVFDESGNPVSGALVKLIVKGDSAQTDKDGKFSIHEDEELSLRPGNFTPGHISVSNGVLRYAQSSNTPVQVSIFDATGNQVLRQELLGSGQVDLRQGVTTQGSYFAKIRVGSAVKTVQFTANGKQFNSAICENRGHKALLKPSEGDSLRVTAPGFDTLNVALSNLDTTITLRLLKTSDE